MLRRTRKKQFHCLIPSQDSFSGWQSDGDGVGMADVSGLRRTKREIGRSKARFCCVLAVLPKIPGFRHPRKEREAVRTTPVSKTRTTLSK